MIIFVVFCLFSQSVDALLQPISTSRVLGWNIPYDLSSNSFDKRVARSLNTLYTTPTPIVKESDNSTNIPQPPRISKIKQLARSWITFVLYTRKYLQFRILTLTNRLFPSKKSLNSSPEVNSYQQMYSKRGKPSPGILKRVSGLLQGRMLLTAAGMAGLYSVFRRLSHAYAAKNIELPYSVFIQLINNTPDLIKSLQITSTGFFYQYGSKSVFTRRVAVDAPLLTLLLDKNIMFSGLAPPKNMFSMVFSIGYMYVMWKVVSKMLQGPGGDNSVGSVSDRTQDQVRLA
jgi:hypothetical protein